MACIKVTNIVVNNNPAPLTLPLSFTITFECLQELQEDVEWRIIYVGEGYSMPVKSVGGGGGMVEDSVLYPSTLPQGSEGGISVSSTSDTHTPIEIELDCVALGPLRKGILCFEFAVNPPDFSKMDPESVLGMQAVLVTASYRKQEFIRIGYFLNHIYVDANLRENPPYPPELSKVARCIIDDSPRVTRFHIHWDEPNPELEPPVENPEAVAPDETNDTFKPLPFPQDPQQQYTEFSGAVMEY